MTTRVDLDGHVFVESQVGRVYSTRPPNVRNYRWFIEGLDPEAQNNGIGWMRRRDAVRALLSCLGED